MSSLQFRITSLQYPITLSAHLLAQLSELNKLRDKVRKAQLAAEKSVQVNRGKGPCQSGAGLTPNGVLRRVH
jgi:hypothetical protein